MRKRYRRALLLAGLGALSIALGIADMVGALRVLQAVADAAHDRLDARETVEEAEELLHAQHLKGGNP